MPQIIELELKREIERRGLSQEAFAREAGISSATLLRAMKGRELTATNWGNILKALARIEPLGAA